MNPDPHALGDLLQQRMVLVLALFHKQIHPDGAGVIRHIKAGDAGAGFQIPAGDGEDLPFHRDALIVQRDLAHGDHLAPHGLAENQL